ncbi:hypothetical protein METP3_02810 [Methanosarcinales archaeon]|nr:hypothetical protein METP3_02810 [Methanosarcinales archaeon]
MNKNIFKSIGAILAGMVTGAVLSISTDFVLETTGIFPPPDQGFFIWWMLVLALIYRGIYTVAAGYITATLAPNQPIRHAIILGIIGVVVTVLGSITNWEKSHAWYPIALILITLPCTWLGGKLAIRR